MKSMIFVISILIFSACSSAPSDNDINTAIANTKVVEAAIQTGIAKTQDAQIKPSHTPLPPTATLTPEPTRTATPTSTSTSTPSYTPTSTSTATNTPTNTPTSTSTPDLLVIAEPPINFKLEKDDMTDDYYLPPGWSSPHHNEEIIQDRGEKEGKEYIQETGRIDGWWQYINLRSTTVKAPQWIFSNPVQYRTSDGAFISLQNELSDTFVSRELTSEIEIELGNAYRIYARDYMEASGPFVYIRVNFVYRNYFVGIVGWGPKDDVEIEYIINAARVVLAKLEAAPLVNPSVLEQD